MGGVSEMRKYQSRAKKVLCEERTVFGLSLKDGSVKQGGPFNCPISIQNKNQKPLPIHDLFVAKFLYDLNYRGL